MTEKEVIRKIKNSKSLSEIGDILYKNQSPNVCLSAVKKNPFSIKYIKTEFRSLDILEYLILKDPSFLEYINKEEQTPELCLLAMSIHPISKTYVRITNEKKDLNLMVTELLNLKTKKNLFEVL